MTGLRVLLAKLTGLWRRGRADRALDEEMRQHLDMLADDYARAGMAPQAARDAARRAFGGVTQAREAFRDQWLTSWMDALIQDLRFGLRALRRSPAFAAAAIGALALGIGVNVAIFGLFDAVLLRSLPVARPAELVALSGNYSFDAFRALAERNADQVDLIASGGIDALDGVVDAGVSEVIDAAFVSGGYFQMLGVAPIAGRTFTAEADQRIGEPAVAVLSDAYWSRRFGRDVTTLGRTITFAGAPVTIVGVSAPGFSGERVGEMPDLWMPLTMRSRLVPGRDLLRARTTAWLDLLGRIPLGRDHDQVMSRLTSHYRQVLGDAFGPDLPADVQRDIDETTITLTPANRGTSNLRARFRDPLWVLLVVVVLILLLACANVANLLLARATSRRREIELRLALGISRGRLVRQLLTESALLSIIGAALGMAVAWPVRELLLRLASGDGTRIALQTSSPRIWLFAVVVAMATTMLFGLAPALASARLRLTRTFATARGVVDGSAGSRTGSVILSLQVGISVVLLVGAGLFLRTLTNLQHVDLGFVTDDRIIVDVNPRAAGFAGEAYAALGGRLLDRLRAVPGVESVTLSENGALMGRESSTDRLRPAGYVAGREGIPRTTFDLVGPDYLEALGARVVAGRGITRDDRVGTPRVIVINETLARRFFEREPAVGRRLLWDDTPLEIVGVVRDVNNDGPRADPQASFYVPYFQHPDRAELASVRFIVRAGADPNAVTASLESTVRAEDPRLTAVTSRLMSDLVDQVLVQERMLARLSGAFAGLALLLTCGGLYGLLSYRVARRTSEIGIRFALGASRRGVAWLVLRHDLLLILAGLAVGLPVAAAASRVATSLFFGVDATDAMTLSAAAAIMLTAGVAAALVPVQRAMAVEPIVALRQD